MISHQELLEALNYDPQTGVFTYKAPRRGVSVGNRAGYSHSCGYRDIKIKDKVYREHRLAWFYVHGRWPSELLDHINGDGLDNRMVNLREASHQENARNRVAKPANLSGRKGVSWHPKSEKWNARIVVSGKVKSLGYYDTVDDAHKAYCDAARREFGDFFNDGKAA